MECTSNCLEWKQSEHIINSVYTNKFLYCPFCGSKLFLSEDEEQFYSDSCDFDEYDYLYDKEKPILETSLIEIYNIIEQMRQESKHTII